MPDKEIEEIRVAQMKWEEKNLENFKCERKKEFVSTDGIPIKRIYTPADLMEKNFDYLKTLNLPGEYPFTRGIDCSMYRAQFYQIGQLAGHSSPEECNELFRDLAVHGEQSFHIAFDLPTLMGYDSDAPEASADVGKTGVAIDSLEDMEIMFDGIDLSKYPIALILSTPSAMTMFAMLLATAEKQGKSQNRLEGLVQNDALTAYGPWGTYYLPPEAALRLATDICTYCVKYLPKYRPFQIMMYPWGEAGANRIQQIAITLGDTIEYIREALKRGLDIDDIGPKLFFLGYLNSTDVLMEIAKIRATRRLYARIMKERFGAKNPASCMFRVHACNGGMEVNKEPLELNIVRGGIATLGMALAGAQSVGGATYDESLGIPSAKASITAIKTRYLVAHECGVSETIDPLAGSYYIEYLTSEIEERAANLITKIDDMGGMLEAIKSGYIQQELTNSAYEIQRKIESGELVKVGLNMLVEGKTEERRDYYKPDTKVRDRQTAKLKALRQRRDNERVKLALNDLQVCARKEAGGDNNLVFPILQAIKAYATVGEIRHTLEEVFGEYRAPSGILPT